MKSFSCVRLFATPWTVAYQVAPSMGFSRQEHWSGLQFPSPEDLPNSGIEPPSPVSPALQGESLLLEPPVKPYKVITRLKKSLLEKASRNVNFIYKCSTEPRNDKVASKRLRSRRGMKKQALLEVRTPATILWGLELTP